MNKPISEPADRSVRFLPLMLILFVGSGCSALIYEIVWFQMLHLVIGSSSISLGVLLGTFMGGMCLGSLMFPRFVSSRHHPLRVYAILELLIGLCAIVLLMVLPRISGLYSSFFEGGAEGIALRAVVCFIALLPPTVLMGATLPAIARWMETTPTGVSRMGMFYGANIAGAVFGCLLTGFWLLRLYDGRIATLTGAGVNGLVTVIAFVIAMKARYKPSESAAASRTQSRSSGNWSVYLVIGMSGFSALGAEVIWTRIQSLLLGATVYTFSIVLAVFLIGLGIGSSVGSALASKVARPREALGWCQTLAVGGIAWSAYVLTQSLPYWPIDVSLSSSPWTTFQLDFVRSAWAVFPAACLWGVSFPLALAAVAQAGQDPGRLVGRVYAANTLGAVAGSMLFSMWLIPQLGTQQAQQVLIVCSAVGALILFLTGWRLRGRGGMESSSEASQGSGIIGALRIPVVAAVAYLCFSSVAAVPSGLIGYGRYFVTYLPPNGVMPNFIFLDEGMNASIAVSESRDGVRQFHVSGKVVASSDEVDMKLQRMLGHIPTMMHPDPKSVLVVGCGAGVTAGCFVPYPGVERIVICEIEPLIPKAAGAYFGKENHFVMDDPRVELVIDDARHFIATTKEKFDIISSDPIHPWVKGAASLYSLEYFELCKKKLNEGGIVTQWVPLYECNEEAVKSQVTTFMRAFPDGTIWGNESMSGGYDVAMLGHNGPTKINVAAMNERFRNPEYAAARQSMIQVGLGSTLRILSTYGGQGTDLESWLDDRYLNRDVNFRLQYLAGMGLNSYREIELYNSILKYRKFPENILVEASEPFKDELAKVLMTPRVVKPNKSPGDQ